MKVINAFDGKEVKVGSLFPDPFLGMMKLIDVNERFLSAKGKIEQTKTGKVVWVPLVVRWTHPSFFLQKVAFINS